MNRSSSQPIDYKTHILIGVRADGVMTAVCDWPYVPTQAEVQQQIDATRNGYITFALCTPTSIMPVDAEDSGKQPGRPRSGRWA